MRVTVCAAIVAAAAILTACTTSTTGNGQHPTGSTSSASRVASSSGGTPSTGSSSATTGSSSPVVSANWPDSVDFTTLSHPDLNCARAGLSGKIDVVKVTPVVVAGISDAVAVLECAHSASEWPQSAYVYSDPSGKPTLVATLVAQSDGMYVTSAASSGTAVTLGEVTWSKFAAGCCPDLNYDQSFTWTGSAFTPGARIGIVGPCGNTAFAVSAGNQQGATGHSSVVLRFTNQLPIACTVIGYPGLDAVDSGGATLAHASRTLHGFAGGAHTIATLTVQPGQSVSALVEWMNFNPSTSAACPSSAAISVTPANTSDTVQLPVQVTTCVLQVHPTVAGTSGNA